MIQIDMEMPKSCKECSLPHIIVNGNYCYSSCSTGRPDWCQLHEVTADPDTVSRKAAMDAVCEELDSIDHVPQWVFDRLTKKIENLPPSPTQSRPQAEMIQESYYSDKLVCSNCGIETRWDYEFCPYCGFKFKQTGGAV